MRMPFALRLFALALLLVPVACRRTAPETTAPSAPDASAPAPKILQLGNGTEPQDLDPHVVTGVSENNIITALLEGLVTHSPTGEGVSPGVATSWETSADRLTWTFHLRPDARWSDGVPLTAKDFLGSFKRILTPSMASEYAYKLYHVVGAEAYHKGELTDFGQTGFSAPDDYTLVIRLAHPVPYLLEALKHYSWFPVPLHVIARLGPIAQKGNRWTRPENFVGNGPFVLKEWLPNQKITVVRSPTYRGETPAKLDAVVFHAIDNLDAEERLFRVGGLHSTYSLPPYRIETWRKERPEVLRVDPYYGVYYYRFNTRRPPLDDVRVRRALSLAIDRDAIVKNITRAGQEPALQFTPPGSGFEPSEKLAAPDLAEARRLLAEAGYPDGRGLRRIELLYNTLETHKAIAEAIQQMWRTGLGIDVALRNEEWKVYLDSVDNGDFDISRAGWIGDYPDPHSFLDLWQTGGGNNDTGYANPDYDRLLATALTAPDEAARMEVYRRLDAMITRDAPVIPLYFYKSVYLLSEDVRGWAPSVLNHRGWQYVDLAR